MRTILAALFLNATAHAAPQLPPFSEAIWGGETLYLSGQLGIAPGGAAPVPGGVTAEARQALDNVGSVLRRHGLDYGHVVRCLVVLRQMSDFAAMNAVYREFFTTPYPARSTVAADLALGANIEVECTAHR